MLYFTLFRWRKKYVYSFVTFLTLLSFPARSSATGTNHGCTRVISNTTGCSNHNYILYLEDKYGNSYYLDGTTATYQWIEQEDGTVRVTATGLTSSGCNGDVLTLDITLSDKTTTAPSGSPKSNWCGSTGSTSDWIYYQTITGTITSKSHGIFDVSRRGSAFQQGTNANVTQQGYGASGWLDIGGSQCNGYYTKADVNLILSSTSTNRVVECERHVTNTVGCAYEPYVLWFKNKYNNAYHFDGDTSSYKWIKYSNGDVRIVANGLTHPSLSGDVYDFDITFSGATTTAPSGSPKASNCGTVGSTSGWIYYTSTLGVVRSTKHGSFIVTRQGPAFQQGKDANITQLGYGASGWLYINGGDGYILNGDINLMLSENCQTPQGECNGTANSYDPCIITLGKGSTGNSTTTIGISEDVSHIKEIVVEGIYKDAQPTYGSFTNGTTTVNWTSSNAKTLDNYTNTSYKGYYTATLPAASSVSMTVGNNKSYMHGLVAYVKLKSEYCASNNTSLTDDRFYEYHSSNTTSITIPATTKSKTITAVIPVVEMNNDSRTATFTLTAGTLTKSVTINTYDLGQSMSLQTLTLEDVPGNITSATVKFLSDNSYGDSYIAGNVSFNWFEPCGQTTDECDGNSVSLDPCIIAYGKGATDNTYTTINIAESVSHIKEIYVEGIYKGGLPTSGSFSNGTNTVSWTSSNAHALNNVSGTSNKGYYSATLPAASSVTMHVQSCSNYMHGFTAYVKLKDEYCVDNNTSLSGEHYYNYHNTSYTYFTMLATTNTKNISVVLPIIKMNNDSRTGTFTLTAGTQSSTVTINTYDLGKSETIQTLTINDVPGNVTTATLTFISDATNGDSYVTGNAIFNWYLPCGNHGNSVNVISGYTYFDRNRDTIQDNNEEDVPGVTVYLYEDLNHNGIIDVTNGEGTPIDTATTDNNGYYEFEVNYECSPKYVKSVKYSSGFNDASNAVGAPGNTYASYTMDDYNLIVELNGEVQAGNQYTVYLKTIEDGAYAIISESSDGINFYHNTNIAITSSGKLAYTVTAARNTKYIKFDKDQINTISGYNQYGSTSTNIKDYAIYGVELCDGTKSYIVSTNTGTLPDNGELTSDNIETASFTSGGNTDSLNNFGINGPVLIDGYVFRDDNANGTKDGGENGQGGVTVYLYNDLNLNGELNDGENTPIDSAITGTDGYYSFEKPFGCMNENFKVVTYSDGIVDQSNLLDAPDGRYASFDTDTDNLIVELDGTVPAGNIYSLYLGAIESGAIAIISESADGTNFQYNTTINITSTGEGVYDVVASTDTRFIKFDKNSINSLTWVNQVGGTTTGNSADYAIYGLNFCNSQENGYITNTKLSDYPSGSSLTTDNIENAQFDSYGQEDNNNNFGFVSEVGTGPFCGSLKITINHEKVDGDNNLTNFPVYFDITRDELKKYVYGQGGGIASNDGYDVQLTNQAGQRLDIEIVSYDGATGHLIFWGNVDVLKYNENTILYLRHGNVDSANVNPSSTSTWNSSYRAVYHFEDVNDATGNDNDATNYGTSNTSGFLGNARNFGGSSYMRVSHNNSLDINGKNLTMSAWVRISGTPVDDAPFAVKGSTVNQEEYMFGVDGGTNPVAINSRVTTNTGHYRDDNGSVSTYTWALVHFVYDGNLGSNQKKVYINGSLAYSASASGNINAGNNDLFIGKRLYSDNRYFKGKIDELRISSASQSSGWVKTEFNNQFSPSTFFQIETGTECTQPVPVTWVDFQARPESVTTNRLTWATASEQDNDHFEIERRWEGETEFTTIGKVTGAGNSSTMRNYVFPDYFGEAKSNIVYYRIKQVDFNGDFDYSVTRMIDLTKGNKGEGLVLNMFPVPSRTDVYVELKSTDQITTAVPEIRITNMSGQVVSQEVNQNVDGNYIHLDVSNLPTGVYVLEISVGYNTEVLRLLVDQNRN
ncbi:MAG: T9SS type A sorting domain-containing protein [Bacteroidetes bacterium]|nr:T9SS type A sorting domain-containing protein [Bacteroidota bacterium]